MGNHPQPKKPAQIILFNENLLHLHFDKSSFIDKGPLPAKIIVVQSTRKEIIGKTYSNDCFIELKDYPNVLNEIKNSPTKSTGIEFYGIWNEKKFKDDDSSESVGRFSQSIQYTPKANLYNLDLNDEEHLVMKIQEYREMIKNYPKNYIFEKMNILLVGLSFSGKSSLINSFHYCLNDDINPIAYTAPYVGESSTLTFQEKKLLPWLSLWDSPGVEKGRNGGIHLEIPEFYDKTSLKNICVHTELVTDQELNNLKVNVNNELPVEKQIHSVIFTWRLSGHTGS